MHGMVGVVRTPDSAGSAARMPPEARRPARDQPIVHGRSDDWINLDVVCLQ